MTKINARALLQDAALSLFQEQGYDSTTTADIAERAGMTERTLFRYFPDKKELLFDDEATGCLALIAMVGEAPAYLGPVDALFHAFREVEPVLRDARGYAEPRFRIVSATPALQERELSKIVALTTALADALERRGVARMSASLAARIGMAAFGDALEAWFADETCSYRARLDRGLAQLKAMVAATT